MLAEGLNDQDIAESGTILRVLVGSTIHGLHLEGRDDRDEMGVCLPPATHVVGLQKFEQWVHRTQPEGVKSGPGDLDLTIYSAQKFCRLALNGNPSILTVLFVETPEPLIETADGRALRALAPAFASRRAGKAFLGYLHQQRERLEKKRGQLRVTRTDLESMHGYDTKYAMHMLRLGYQGIEYLATGRLTLPMPEPERTVCRAVRTGGYALSDLLHLADSVEEGLKRAYDDTELPEKPDFAAVNDWLVSTHLRAWNP